MWLTTRSVRRWVRHASSRVALDGTHHVNAATGQPLYARRFDWVLPYHEPGLAPVGLSGRAWHVRPDGSDAYAARFMRTFGFYEHFAAVATAPTEWYHVHPSGERAYTASFAWVGNFQGGVDRCAARLADGRYVHVDARGAVRTRGPHVYAGDFREGLAVVRSAHDGLCRHVDPDGALPPEARGRGWRELGVFHKGYACARDARGWFFLSRAGGWEDACRGARYAALEPFYNGQAAATRLDGSRCVLAEGGAALVELASPPTEVADRLQALATGYWPSLALRAGLLEGLPAAALDARGVDTGSRVGVLAAAWAELGLLREQQHASASASAGPMAARYSLTPAGAALQADAPGRARAAYWLQDRYMRAWLPGFASSETPAVLGNPQAPPPDTFADLSRRPRALVLSRGVLASYARDS